MAEVLAPIVSQPSTITMLHTPSDAFTNPTSTQTHQSTRSPAMSRYTAQGNGMGYRGTSATPVAPYAFQSTPQLRQEHRTSSAPGNPYTAAATQNGSNPPKQWHPSNPSSSSDSTASTASSSRSFSTSKDDSIIQSTQSGKVLDGAEGRAAPTLSLSPLPDLSLSLDAPVKASPNRYRRGPQRSDSNNGPPTPTQQQQQQPPTTRSALPSGSGMAAVAHLYKGAAAPELANRPGHHRTGSADDFSAPKQGSSEQAKRYRRRSLGALEVDLLNAKPAETSAAPTAKPQNATAAKRPESKENKPSQQSLNPSTSFHQRNVSGESISSNNSNRPSSKNSSRPSSARQESRRPSTPSIAPAATTTTSNQGKTINVPPRNSSDATKRLASPSPLSKPVPTEVESPPRPATAVSPAVQQLAALTEKENKGMKSRLRRAFSFGSAAELRRASAENSLSKNKNKTLEEIEAEHEAIAAKQEAAGIGAGIYSGQGGLGSTDNLSISSTASSASIMLRKMGKGMKRGTRSLKGLFRPKSVVGVPAADAAATQPTLAQVSMVTVEAEREKVNVNASPHDQVGGGTGFPKLERNSLDAAVASRDAPGSSAGKGASADLWSRKSIIGGDKERAEVLAAVRKGILKRSTGTGSDSGSPVIRSIDNNDTPNSSAPSTPADDQAQHGQLLGTDYFNGMPRLPNTSSKSLPNTPHGSARTISFSPRIQFHDAWSSSDYDRRGDIATCNRLTPMLAQQIKEELNSFKMEMEVHESSKPHTHFF